MNDRIRQEISNLLSEFSVNELRRFRCGETENDRRNLHSLIEFNDFELFEREVSNTDFSDCTTADQVYERVEQIVGKYNFGDEYSNEVGQIENAICHKYGISPDASCFTELMEVNDINEVRSKLKDIMNDLTDRECNMFIGLYHRKLRQFADKLFGRD